MSNFDKLRLGSTVRGAIIAYGVGAFGLLAAFGGSSIQAAASSRQTTYMVLSGLAIQVLLLVARRFAARYERQAGRARGLSPMVTLVVELAADAVTVFLFALATFQGILQHADSL